MEPPSPIRRSWSNSQFKVNMKFSLSSKGKDGEKEFDNLKKNFKGLVKKFWTKGSNPNDSPFQKPMQPCTPETSCLTVVSRTPCGNKPMFKGPGLNLKNKERLMNQVIHLLQQQDMVRFNSEIEQMLKVTMGNVYDTVEYLSCLCLAEVGVIIQFNDSFVSKGVEPVGAIDTVLFGLFGKQSLFDSMLIVKKMNNTNAKQLQNQVRYWVNLNRRGCWIFASISTSILHLMKKCGYKQSSDEGEIEAMIRFLFNIFEFDCVNYLCKSKFSAKQFLIFPLPHAVMDGSTIYGSSTSERRMSTTTSITHTLSVYDTHSVDGDLICLVSTIINYFLDGNMYQSSPADDNAFFHSWPLYGASTSHHPARRGKLSIVEKLQGGESFALPILIRRGSLPRDTRSLDLPNHIDVNEIIDEYNQHPSVIHPISLTHNYQLKLRGLLGWADYDDYHYTSLTSNEANEWSLLSTKEFSPKMGLTQRQEMIQGLSNGVDCMIFELVLSK